jgi:hypothetical protein
MARLAGTDIREKHSACLAWEPKVEVFEVLNVASRR